MRIAVISASCIALISSLTYCRSAKVVTVPEVYQPDAKQTEAAQKRWGDARTEDIKAGQQIFVTSCVRCHKNHDVTRFSEERWSKIIDKMAPKARLTPEEKEKLTVHILSLRDSRVTP